MANTLISNKLNPGFVTPLERANSRSEGRTLARGQQDVSTFEYSQDKDEGQGADLFAPPGFAEQTQALFADLTPNQRDQLTQVSQQLAQSLLQEVSNRSRAKAEEERREEQQNEDNPWDTGPSKLPTLPQGASTTTSALTAANAGATTPSDVVPPGRAINDAKQAVRQTNKATDYDSEVLRVTHLGLMGLYGDLGDFSKKVKGNLQYTQQLRVDKQAILDQLQTWPDDGSQQTIVWHTRNQFGEVQEHQEQLTKEEAKQHAEGLDLAIQNQTDMTTHDQIMLQYKMGQFTEAYSLLSNLMKANHDTVKNTIGNVR